MERPTYLTRRRWNEWAGAEIIPEKKLDIDKCAICLEIINFHNIKIFHKKKYKNISQAEKNQRLHKGLTAYPIADKISTLSCKHKFHENCIKKWFKRSPTCPLCRN